MKTIPRYLTAACLVMFLLPGQSARGEEGLLPAFTFQGVALHPDDLAYAPTAQLIHPTIIKTEGRVKNALGKYYLYYAPHKHIATSMAYSDRLEGPWTEYGGNPVIQGPSAPDIRWIDEQGKFYMWGHRKNSKTELWTSDDGIRFEYQGVSVTAEKIGTRNATYSRVYEYPLPRYGSKYIMLYSGFIEGRGIRCVWLAHSKDAENWIQLKTPLVEPVEGENSDAYDPALLQWNGRNFIVYQDHTAWRGGNIKCVEVDNELNPVGGKGERFVLLDPPSDPPLNDRYRGAEFYSEGDTVYMYASASSDPRVIVFATANAVPTPALSGALRKSGLPEGKERVMIALQSTFSGLTVEVKIDGEPVTLILDTGCTFTILSEEAAERLGLKPRECGAANARDISGTKVVVRRALTKRISLGKAWAENEPVLIAKIPEGFGDGLLGLSTLADWDVRINPAEKTLTLLPGGNAKPLDDETVIRLNCELVNPEASASNPQGLRGLNLQVPVRLGSQVLAARPDTGFGGTLQLPSALMHKFAPAAMKEALPAVVQGTSLSGRKVSRTARLPEFTFGSDTLRGLSMEVVDAAPGSSSERMGFVGMNLLRHYVMTFRFSAGELRLRPLGTVQEITRSSTAGIFLSQDRKIIGMEPDGPAAKAGLLVGDEVLEIEGRPLKTMKPEEFRVFKQLPPGTNVKVRFRRGEAEPVEVTLALVQE